MYAHTQIHFQVHVIIYSTASEVSNHRFCIVLVTNIYSIATISFQPEKNICVGEAFSQLCHQSAHEWQSYIVRHLTERKLMTADQSTSILVKYQILINHLVCCLLQLNEYHFGYCMSHAGVINIWGSLNLGVSRSWNNVKLTLNWAPTLLK